MISESVSQMLNDVPQLIDRKVGVLLALEAQMLVIVEVHVIFRRLVLR